MYYLASNVLRISQTTYVYFCSVMVPTNNNIIAKNSKVFLLYRIRITFLSILTDTPEIYTTHISAVWSKVAQCQSIV